eukprot:1719905-Pyramimonas_sp.AAC.1
MRHCGYLSSFSAPNVAPLLDISPGAADQKNIPTNPFRTDAQASRGDHGSGAAYRGTKGWGGRRTPGEGGGWRRSRRRKRRMMRVGREE